MTPRCSNSTRSRDWKSIFKTIKWDYFRFCVWHHQSIFVFVSSVKFVNKKKNRMLLVTELTRLWQENRFTFLSLISRVKNIIFIWNWFTIPDFVFIQIQIYVSFGSSSYQLVCVDAINLSYRFPWTLATALWKD